MSERANRPRIDWVAVRLAYEASDEPMKDILIRFGISKGGLEYRFRKEGWLPRRATGTNRRRFILNQLHELLARQVIKLANQKGENLGDRETQQLSEVIKNFEKLGALVEDKSLGSPSQGEDMRDLREKLAKRIDQRNRR